MVRSGKDVQVTVERRYRKPPVVEALCEIHFGDSTWEPDYPDRFHRNVNVDFPRRESRERHHAHIRIRQGIIDAGIQELSPWDKFVDDEHHRMIQLAKETLVVNQLAPYPGFEDWERHIYTALKAYQDVASPATIRRIGVRYINRVILPHADVNMGDYFTVYPQLPEQLGQTHDKFVIRVEIPQEQGHELLITFASADPEDRTQSGFMLDLYVQHAGPGSMDVPAVRQNVQLAHTLIIRAFEGSITDRLRELFEVEA